MKVPAYKVLIALERIEMVQRWMMRDGEAESVHYRELNSASLELRSILYALDIEFDLAKKELA